MEDGHLIGQTVGNYRIQALLGEGGMGTVYLAEHTFMGWRAAVKVLRRSLAEDKVLVTRFINEARAAKAVGHPNVIDIIDAGVLPDGLPYLLMEMLEGETLAARLKRLGRLPVEQALDITRQAAAGLGAVHDAGIVHRDLKPDNLFLVPDPDNAGRERVKVLDFGIAKLDDGGGGGHARTRSGVLLGTPAYMSPEQCRSIPVNLRSDVYALSIILYEMLAGRPPFASAGPGELIILQVDAPPPPVRLENPGVPQFVEDAILRGLAKPRDQRFQSMRELSAALDGFGQSTVVMKRALPQSRQRLTVPLSTPVTPLQWPTAGPATRASRSLRREVRAIVLAVAIAIPLTILIASDVVRAPAPSPAPVEAPGPGGLTPEDPPPPAPGPVPRQVVQEPPPPPAAPPRAPESSTPAPPLMPAPEVARRRVPEPTVTVSVLNPPMGLTVRVDGRPSGLPIRLPRDGKNHRIELQAPKFLGETKVLRGDQDQTLYLDNTPVIRLD